MKKIAFIKLGSFSHINASVEQLLRREFPEFELKVLDVEKLVLHQPWIRFANLPHALARYGADLIRGRHGLAQCLLRTPFIFQRTREVVAKQLEPDLADCAFSLQTQSLFDVSVPGLPHFVYTDHTHLTNLGYPAFNKSGIFPQAWIRIEGTIYHNAAKVFTMSRHVQHSLIDQYHCDPARVACVYAGSNTHVPSVPLQNDEYRNKHILFVGKDWKRKGGPALAAAFKTILQVHPDARLTIIGCSPELSLPNCEIVGRVSLETVQSYYPRASIFCLPTRIEPFGIVFIETMLNRIPVVATRIGALPDFIEHGKNGLLVKPDDVAGLTAALLELLEDPAKCRRFGEAGHQIVKERYSWEAVGVRLRAEIEATLGHAEKPLAVHH